MGATGTTSRRALLGGIAALVFAGLVPASALADVQKGAKAYLFKGGWLVAPDRPVTIGNVLVVGRRIVAVGPNVALVGARVIDCRGKIVTVPWVDCHCHGWESPFAFQMNGKKFGDYIGRITIQFLGLMTAAEIGQAERFNALQAINRGIGTMCVWCHAVRTLDDAMHALHGAMSTKVRTVWLHGNNSTQFPGGDPVFGDVERTFAEARRLGAAKMGIAVVGPQFQQSLAPFAEQQAFSLAHPGTLLATHDVAFPPANRLSAAGLAADAGLTGPNQLWAHLTGAGPEVLHKLADDQVGVTVSPLVDGRVFVDALIEVMIEFGLKPAVSSDDAAIGGGQLVNHVQAYVTAQHRMADPNPMTGPLGRFVTDEEALAAVTTHAAHALKLSGIARLEPEYAADIVVIDPAFMDLPFIPEIATAFTLAREPVAVRLVMVGGEILKDNGELVGVDMEREKRQAQATAKRVMAAA